MKINPCIKHERQEPFSIYERPLMSGDSFFQVKCMVCGKLGPRRKTIHGAQMAWNEDSNGVANNEFKSTDPEGSAT